MAEGFKTRRGGGGTSKQPFGVLTANFPSGIVTVTNGTISMTATGTPALFAIPEAGTWTVTAVDGSKRASKSVTFSTQGEVVSVTLVYEIDLYNAGNEYTSVSGGWTLTGNGYSEVEEQADCLYIWNNDGAGATATSGKSIDLSNYSTLHVKMKDSWGTNNGYFTITAGAAVGEYSPGGAKTYTLDISAVSKAQIEIAVYGLWSDDANQLSECGVEISRVWLS